VGMPLALASMRVVLEKMDWGQRLLPEQKFRWRLRTFSDCSVA
jgi:hypothetical protein